MTTALRDDADLTGRARIRDAAFRLFARDGVAATSMRAVAKEAGTSPALVVHHFGSKEQLVGAVDQYVIASFHAALASVSFDPNALSFEAGSAFAQVIGGDPTVRQYLRRALLEEQPSSTALIDDLFDLIAAGLGALDEAGALRDDSDAMWRPYQVLFIVLGPLLLEPLLQRHFDGHAFDNDLLMRRTASNHDVFARGLLASGVSRRARSRNPKRPPRPSGSSSTA
jgi:AcrR family transcriptional regulator